MSFRSQYYSGAMLAWLAAGSMLLHADDAAKGRPTPIIFSAPRSDTVSSNLNQMGAKSSSLRDLESGLKKPFEIFDSGRSGPIQPPNQFTPSTPQPPAISRKMKDALDKRAEESYLLSEDEESQLSRDGKLSPDRDSLDPITGKPRTSLDRYYDRIDRSRIGRTNQTARSLDLFAERDSSDAKGDAKPRTINSLFDSELAPNAYVSGRMSNSISEGGRLFSEKSKPRSYGDVFELGPVETTRQSGRRESRVDEFKRLLDGPGYGARGGFNVASPSSGSPYQLPKPTTLPNPGSSLSPGLQPSGGGSFATTPGFSGTVGVPNGVPEAVSAPSLTITPSVQQQPPAQQPPVPSFKIPRGRF